MEALVIAALAGRRIDAVDTENTSFPLAEVCHVRSEISQLFADESVSHLVCSAACGADLLALSVATEMNLESHIILPFEPKAFLETSVIDRPGEWEEIYWGAINLAKAKGNLKVLMGQVDRDSSYSAVTLEIIRLTVSLAQSSTPLGVAIWDGRSRGPNDATEDFRNKAASSGFQIIDLPTS